MEHKTEFTFGTILFTILLLCQTGVAVSGETVNVGINYPMTGP